MGGETTWSLLQRTAAAYGVQADALLGHWQWRNQRPRHSSGAARADAEVLLDAAGRQVVSALCGVGQEVLARALPSWGREEETLAGPGPSGPPRGLWRVGSAAVGPVAFGCRSCAARRTGAPAAVVRYAQPFERVCGRHGRWGLDADADQVLEHLDVRGLPEVVAASRQWAGVARCAVRAGADPGRVFALAHAVVARWWDEALRWDREEVWPRRLHLVAGGDAGADFERWRAVGRDTVVFPEVVAVAGALLDPAMADLVWLDAGAGRSRPLPADGAFCRELGERVGRPWLGPLAAVDYGGPLIAWMGTVIRARRGVPHGAGRADDPWWVRRENLPVPMATGLRLLAREKKTAGSGTRWRGTVPPEQRGRISRLIDAAQEQLAQLRGAHSGTTAEVAQHLLAGLSHSVGLLDRALQQTAAAAVSAGIPPQDAARWAGLSADGLADLLHAYREEQEEDEEW
jgi:hypothetical protein